MTKEEKNAYFKDLTTNARKSIKLFFICDKTLKENNLEISQNEIAEEMSENKLDVLALNDDDNKKQEQLQSEASARLVVKKALDFIISKALHT